MKETQYPNYFVNEQGEFFSTKLNKVRKLKGSNHPEGYLIISIYNNNKAKQLFAHRLVAQTFIPNPQNKSQVNHKNGIKTDNRVHNLEWVTPKENTKHAIFIGLHNTNDGNHYNTKLTNEEVLQIRELYVKKEFNQQRIGYSLRKLGEIYGVDKATISKIINNKTYNQK